MNIINLKNIKKLAAVFVVAFTVLVSNSVARPKPRTVQPPNLPNGCGSIEVEDDHKIVSHVYANGVQIYSWNGSAWTFVAPSANLYATARYKGKVGFHYAGPTWESKSGSKVLAARVPNTGCTPDATAIPWLLLKTVSTEGRGIFRKVTYIQRVATRGGLTPTASGSTVGEERRVPYTAEYYFYRAQKEN